MRTYVCMCVYERTWDENCRKSHLVLWCNNTIIMEKNSARPRWIRCGPAAPPPNAKSASIERLVAVQWSWDYTHTYTQLLLLHCVGQLFVAASSPSGFVVRCIQIKFLFISQYFDFISLFISHLCCELSCLSVALGPPPHPSPPHKVK